MLEDILVPLDGSSHSEEILTQVKRLLLRKEARVTLLGVAVPLLERASERPEDRADHDERHPKLRLEEARRHLQELAAKLKGEGIDVSWDAVIGDPAATIVARAEHDKASLVAMASHGRSGLGRLLRGSVAERVLRRCPVPLLLVNPDRSKSVGLRFRKILVPLDGSERSASILPLVTEFAKLHESKVVLMRVGFVPAPNAESMGVLEVPDQAQLEASLKPALEQLTQAGIETSIRVAFGSPAGEILAAAEEEETDLVALSTHGHTGIDRWLFGSVSENVLRHCAAPLLVLRTVSGPPGSGQE